MKFVGNDCSTTGEQFAIIRWVAKGKQLPGFLWTPGKGTSMDKPEIQDGALVKLDASVGGGFGRVKSLFQGDREAIRALGVGEALQLSRKTDFTQSKRSFAMMVHKLGRHIGQKYEYVHADKKIIIKRIK